jgi:hypothetical protein
MQVKVFGMLDKQRGQWGLGVVAHACNPSYMGGRDQEGHDLRLAQLVRPHSINMLGMVVYVCRASYMGRLGISTAWAKTVRPYPKSNLKQKELKALLKCRAHASQAQSHSIPKTKQNNLAPPQCCQKNTTPKKPMKLREGVE